MKKLSQLSILLLSIILLLGSCQTAQQSQEILLENGMWKGILTLREGADLPFQFDLEKVGDNYNITIYNAEERIEVSEIEQRGDSLFIKMPVFDSEFKLHIDAPTALSGDWYEYTRGIDYHVPFRAIFREQTRFPNNPSTANLATKYAVVFDPKGEKPNPAIGEFKVDGNKVVGTFQTETGDYRFLEGAMDGNILRLSAFDGSHAFLFEAEVNDQSLSGHFWSGNHWLEPWEGIADPQASLRDPDELTYLRKGFDTFIFKFPNLDGDSISFDSPRFDSKVVLVQLMGSWCPNCMDETRLYTKWYEKYKNQGLEIVGVAFERTSKGMPQAQKNIKRMAKRLGANYPFLIAATANDKSLASEKFPMLNEIISFPTSIFLDKEKRVRKIHTGFNGPGTGDIYTRYVEEYEAFLEKLLQE